MSDRKGHWDGTTYVSSVTNTPPQAEEMGLPYNDWTLRQIDLTYLFNHKDYPTVIFFWAPVEGTLSGLISFHSIIQSKIFICHDRELISEFVHEVLDTAKIPLHEVPADDLHFVDLD